MENVYTISHILIDAQGDFDYQDDPEQWFHQMDDILGSDFPYFASVGNHDMPMWPTYQEGLVRRLDRIRKNDASMACEGEYGVNSWCRYKGLFFVLSGVGTIGKDHDIYLKKVLTEQASGITWKVCSWHKNQRKYQTGLSFGYTLNVLNRV